MAKSDPPPEEDEDELGESPTLVRGYVKRLADRAGVSRRRINEAVLIYRCCDELVDRVMSQKHRNRDMFH